MPPLASTDTVCHTNIHQLGHNFGHMRTRRTDIFRKVIYGIASPFLVSAGSAESHHNAQTKVCEARHLHEYHLDLSIEQSFTPEAPIGHRKSFM